jgi:methyl-accepting chemotaxis protein
MSAVETTFNQIITLRRDIDGSIESLDETTAGVEPVLNTLSVVAVAELDEASQDLAATQQVVLIFKVVVMVMGIIIGTRLALYSVRSISEPLGRLVWVTKRVGEGDLNQRADLQRNDEIGRLGAAFDHMVVQLQDNMSNQVARAQVERVVAQYRDVVSRVAQGDLTAQLELDMLPGQTDASSDDLYQLGANLNLMVENLRSMTIQIRDTASAVARAVTEIEAATTQQLATTSEQDAAITQTMATVEEVRTTVNQTADRAQQVAQSSRQSVTASRQGEEIVLNTITGMETVQMRVNDIAKTILSLSERTQQIGEIIDTVNGLAEQSKLLALNASIEAARAGEEGRGFAVVALEVRQLAEQSREATNRVHGILNEIQQATNTAVMVTEEGSKGAIEGMSLVERAGDTIRELGNVLEEAMQAATQIAASTHQQTSGMDQLAAAMSQIQQAATQAAASADQTEQNVRNIVTMSQQLEEAASRYQL